MTPKTVGLIVFEQMAATELAGPAEAFSRARMPTSNGGQLPCYRVLTLGISTGRCLTECGFIVMPQLDINESPPLDTLIVPGGNGIHDARLSKKMAKWLSRRVPTTRRVAILGSGIYALAATGLLDEHRVAVHWRLAKDVALRFPKLRVTSSSLFVRDGPFCTCAGGTSAIDLSLSLIEEDYGRQIALNLARELLLHSKRSGEQGQYSEPLKFQIESSERFADLAAWILCNLDQNLSVEALAQRACMSPRNFALLFKQAFGTTPAKFVTAARIREAQLRLRVPRNSIESVGASIGFRSTDVFSRTFERLVGIRPCSYRGLTIQQRSRQLRSVRHRRRVFPAVSYEQAA